MSEKPEDIELRSDEVQEILSHVPNWLIRWGLTLLLGIIVILIGTSWVIKYPDVIKARIVVTTETPPVDLVAKSAGKIDFKVSDQQLVKAGQVLALIENPSVFNDVLLLDSLMNFWRSKLYDSELNFERLVYPNSLDVGGMQNLYMDFISNVENAKRYVTIAIPEKRKSSLTMEMNAVQEQIKRYQNQMLIISDELIIAKENFKDDSVLLKTGAISKRELTRSKEKYLQALKNVENNQLQITKSKQQLIQLSGKLGDVSLQNLDRLSELRVEMVDAYERLESAMLAWKQQYLLISPTDGVVSFSDVWTDNQYVEIGSEVLTVIPPMDQLIGKLQLPIARSGKVEEGQKVNIKFDNYPFEEFGIVVGEIESIPLVPKDDFYAIKVVLPDGLVSSYDKTLGFKQEMQGSAEVITEEKRILQRVFYQLQSMLEAAK